MKKTFKQIITDYINALCGELRASIDHNKQKPRTPKLNKLGRLAIIFCCVLYFLIGCLGGISSHAVDVEFAEGDPSSAPTDLTGYTVTIPSSWTATSGYGQFLLEGVITTSNKTLNEVNFDSFNVGYSLSGFSLVPLSNSFVCQFTSVDNSESFTLNIIGGADASNSSLLEFLVDNNATFVNNNVPDDPDEPEEPTTVTVPAGLYYLQNTYNDLRGTINFSVPFISKSTYFNAITFAGIDNEQYVSINYAGDNILPNVYNGVDGWSFAEYSVIYVQSDIELSEAEYTLFESAFVSFVDNPELDILFQAGQENGHSSGYSQGFNAGRTEGYNDGFNDGRADALGDNFMGDFFGGVVRALDALKLFGDVSMLNIIEGILGIMLALWVLKLIAGG